VFATFSSALSLIALSVLVDRLLGRRWPGVRILRRVVSRLF
jgi:hypothetical protein